MRRIRSQKAALRCVGRPLRGWAWFCTVQYLRVGFAIVGIKGYLRLGMLGF
jgi:hypothetical protein